MRDLIRKLVNWIWERLPCDHDWEIVHTESLGAYQTKHHFRCKKCSCLKACDCVVCREPWRDW